MSTFTRVITLNGIKTTATINIDTSSNTLELGLSICDTNYNKATICDTYIIPSQESVKPVAKPVKPVAKHVESVEPVAKPLSAAQEPVKAVKAVKVVKRVEPPVKTVKPVKPEVKPVKPVKPEVKSEEKQSSPAGDAGLVPAQNIIDEVILQGAIKDYTRYCGDWSIADEYEKNMYIRFSKIDEKNRTELMKSILTKKGLTFDENTMANYHIWEKTYKPTKPASRFQKMSEFAKTLSPN